MGAEVFSFLHDFHTNASKEVQSDISLYKAAQPINNSKGKRAKLALRMF
jgi:hypothetical protein